MAVPFGALALEVDGRRLVRIRFVDASSVLAPPPCGHPAVAALRAWFRDPRRVVLPPLAPAPTPFQQRVREALLAIPCAETRTYGELACLLGTSPRAVGQACRANPVPILVPCHRVVASAGIGGYAGTVQGERLGIKQWLLAHERMLEKPSP